MGQIIGYNLLTLISFIIVLVYGLVMGWSRGLIKEACATAGIGAGVLFAYYCYDHFQWPLGSTLLVCLVIPIALSIVASGLSKFLDHIVIVGTVNKLGGAVVGCLKYVVLLWLITKIIASKPEWENLLLTPMNM